LELDHAAVHGVDEDRGAEGRVSHLDPVEAVRVLEGLCRTALHFALKRLKLKVDEEEVLTTLLALLLVAKPGSTPKLDQYAGRSELRRWLQVIAGHHLLKARKWQGCVEPLPEALLTGLGRAEAREWKQLDTAMRQKFKDALSTAFAKLSCQDRNLLRMRLDGLSTVAIARFFGVQHTTVSRWITRASLTVEHAVRRELRESLKLGGGDLDSLVRSVLNQIDSSIRCQVSLACGNECG
jgi:RNA polymerase sigma-70 factor